MVKTDGNAPSYGAMSEAAASFKNARDGMPIRGVVFMEAYVEASMYRELFL